MKKQISFSIAIIIIVVCAILVAGLVVWQYLGMPREEKTSEETLPKEDIYLIDMQGVSLNKYLFVNINTEKVEKIISDGYKIVSQSPYGNIHFIGILPDFFILQKDNKLFTFSSNSGIINEIPVGVLKQSELVEVSSSISEQDKFFLIINDTKEPYDEIISSRKYFFNATNNYIKSADGVDLPWLRPNQHFCYKYDSKYFRFFAWQCGAGVSTPLPLLSYDIASKTEKEIINYQDFNRDRYFIGLDFVSIRYNNGYFLVIPEDSGTFDKIIVVNPKDEEIIKEVYTISETVRLKFIYDFYHCDGLVVKEKNTIIISRSGHYSGYSDVLFLHFNNDKQITDSFYILGPEDVLFCSDYNFIHENKLYLWFQDKKLVRIIDISDMKIERDVSLGKILEKVVSKDETADWKTYKNEEYGFELKYPKDWFPYFEPRDNGEYKFEIYEGIDRNKTPMPILYDNWMSISIYCSHRTNNKESLEEIVLSKNEDIKILKKTINNGIERIDVVEPEIVSPRSFFLANDNIICEGYLANNYNVDYRENKEQELESLLNQVLSTFRFLE